MGSNPTLGSQMRDDRKNIRSALIYSLLTVGLIVAFFFVGLPSLAKFTGFLSDLTKGNSPIEISDKTPPAPPQFTNLPEATNQNRLKLEGSSEPAAIITLTFNSRDEEVVADREGNFSLNLALRKGENTLSAVSRDEAGNQSQPTKVFKVVQDNTSPEIQITAPAGGTTFFGIKQKNLTIEGKVDEKAELTINDRLASVGSDGTFKFLTTLSDGENTFSLKARDEAGNESEVSLTVSFSP